MAGRIHKLDVSNVRDIPAMLEQWATWLRDGAEEKPETLLMILVPPGEGVPELCVFGEDMQRYELAGCLLAMANQHVRMDLEEQA